MGGLVNVLIRFSDDDKKSFCIHSSQIQDFETPLFLEEENFKSRTMQNYYKNESEMYKADFTPDRGILFFDFKNKKIFSRNHYKFLFSFSPKIVFSKLTELICISRKLDIHLYDSEEIVEGFNEDRTKLEIVERNKIFHEPSLSNNEFYMLSYALNNDWNIKVCGKEIQHNKDFIEFINDITGEDVINNTNKWWDGDNFSIKKSLHTRPDYKDYRIKINPKGWDVTQDYGDYHQIKELFEYMTHEKILDENEITLWQNLLKDMKKHLKL